MKRVYLVHVPEFVLIVEEDGQDFFGREREAEASAHASERVRMELLSQGQLARHGDEYPAGWWNPDREMTCAEIAADMNAPIVP